MQGLGGEGPQLARQGEASSGAVLGQLLARHELGNLRRKQRVWGARSRGAGEGQRRERVWGLWSQTGGGLEGSGEGLRETAGLQLPREGGKTGRGETCSGWTRAGPGSWGPRGSLCLILRGAPGLSHFPPQGTWPLDSTPTRNKGP